MDRLRWLLCTVWLTWVWTLAPACGPAMVQLAEGRTLADRVAAQKIAELETVLRPERPGLRLALRDYEVSSTLRDSANEPGYSFLYVHRTPSIGLGPGQAHFVIWVSRVNGHTLYLPGK